MTHQSLSIGKLEPRRLRQLVFSCLGATDSRVIVGPKVGEDAAVIDFQDKVIVVHSDPITGAIENVGRLAINVCTNDIATRGIRPQWILESFQIVLYMIVPFLALLLSHPVRITHTY